MYFKNGDPHQRWSLSPHPFHHPLKTKSSLTLLSVAPSESNVREVIHIRSRGLQSLAVLLLWELGAVQRALSILLDGNGQTLHLQLSCEQPDSGVRPSGTSQPSSTLTAGHIWEQQASPDQMSNLVESCTQESVVLK